MADEVEKRRWLAEVDNTSLKACSTNNFERNKIPKKLLKKFVKTVDTNLALCYYK